MKQRNKTGEAEDKAVELSEEIKTGGVVAIGLHSDDSDKAAAVTNVKLRVAAENN